MFLIRNIEVKSIPFDRIRMLIEAAKEIPNVYTREHPGTETPLGADDFLPIFIYVVVRAQIQEIALINEELQALCDPDSRLSEAGYYLATLEATIHHILEIDLDAGVERMDKMNSGEGDEDDGDDGDSGNADEIEDGDADDGDC